MKKTIVIILGIFILAAFAGGVYLLLAVEHRISSFDRILKLYQVENLREQLLLNVQKVEADLYSQGTDHPVSAEAVENHLVNIENSIDACFECHHSRDVLERLDDLHQQIRQYHDAIGNGANRRPGALRLPFRREKAHLIGDSLIGKVETMIVLSVKKLNEQTEDSLRSVRREKFIMLALIAAGPLLMIVFAFTVIRGVTGPVLSLLEATRKLKAGHLDHRITGLKDEFGELAVAFNDMAGALSADLRAIEESEKRYRLLFESAADSIFILEAEGERVGGIVQANQAAANMHGYTVEELMTLNIMDIDSPEAAAAVPERIERIRRGEWIKAEINHRRKDGTVFPMEVSAGLLELGGRKYILAMDRDISERKRAEEALQRTERSRVAGELATGLAHEIKNPLAGIKVSMEALSGEAYLSDEDRNVLNSVIGEIGRIEVLMKGLLNFARPPKPQLVSTDVNAVLENVAKLALKDRSRSRSGAGAIHLVRDLEKSLPRIMADAMQLRQIFLNLILNAVDAMPDGGTVTIKTAFNMDTDTTQIELSDTGPGIDSAVMARIFNPFFTTKAKGTGLGLSITRRLVEEHGGGISLENNENGGVTCRITLSIKQREGAPAL
jgi:two-component system sensor histidine kinase AtoS